MSVISIMESVINIALIQWVVIDVIVVWDIASMMTDTIALILMNVLSIMEDVNRSVIILMEAIIVHVMLDIMLPHSMGVWSVV
jgi:hypothetical protein